jgi:hypothetical protein
MSGLQLVCYENADTALAALEMRGHCARPFIPDTPGVYVLDWLFKQILYVGESTNLRRRLRCHERGWLLRRPGVCCRTLPCENHKQVETWLIEALRPALNGVSDRERRHREESPEETVSRLRKEAHAKLRHADALEAWGRQKFGRVA